MSSTPVHFTVLINIGLAIIPAILSFYLFKISKQRTYLWWLLALIMIAFLPNSAYALTDVIHLIAAVKSPEISFNYLVFVLVPLFILYFVICFEFYALSISWAQQYMVKQYWSNLAKLYVPSIHFLCAIGVYLGRVQRLESDDIAIHPWVVLQDLELDLTQEHSLLYILGLFCGFYLLYQIVVAMNFWLSKKYKRVND